MSDTNTVSKKVELVKNAKKIVLAKKIVTRKPAWFHYVVQGQRKTESGKIRLIVRRVRTESRGQTVLKGLKSDGAFNLKVVSA